MIDRRPAEPLRNSRPNLLERTFTDEQSDVTAWRKRLAQIAGRSSNQALCRKQLLRCDQLIVAGRQQV